MTATNTINNKIKFIPTELNAFTYLKHKYTKQQKTIKSLCKWLVILLIWCAALTIFTGYKYYQEQQETINQTIINQENIPLTNITLEELEVIND